MKRTLFVCLLITALIFGLGDNLETSAQQLHRDVDQLLRLGRPSDAMAALEKMPLEERRKSPAQIQIARSMMQLGQAPQGENILRQVLESDPLNVEARVVLGKYYVFQQLWQEAHRVLNEALKLDPNHPTALVFMAKYLAQKGDAPKAQQLIQKAALLAPNDENIQFELGMNHLANGDLVKAQQAFGLAASLNPKLDRGMLARIYLHYKFVDQAVMELESVASKIITKVLTERSAGGQEASVTDSEMGHLLLLSESYDMIGQAAEALDMYKFVLSVEPGNVLANAGAGLLLLGTGSRNFAALNACGLNEKSALEHLEAALHSNTAKGQSASTVKNAQDLAQRAVEWCRSEQKSVERWSDICKLKRAALLSGLPREFLIGDLLKSGKRASPAAAVSASASSSSLKAGLSVSAIRNKIVRDFTGALKRLFKGVGLCPRWLERIAFLRQWASWCGGAQDSDATSPAAPAAAASVKTAGAGGSKEEVLYRASDDDTAKIAAMKKSWKARQGMQTVPRISIIGAGQAHGEKGSAITAAQFFDKFVRQSRPAVIANLQADWGLQGGPQESSSPRDIFTIAGLVGAFGNSTVTVSVSQHGRFDGPEKGDLWGLDASTDVLVRPPTTSMKLVDYFALQQQGTSNAAEGATFYLEYLALHQYLGQEFLGLISLPEPILALTKRRAGVGHNTTRPLLQPLVTNLWIGGSPTISPLHYDDYENLLAQIRGHKELVLFPPTDGEYLYYVGRPKGVLKYEYPDVFQRDPGSVDKRGFVFGSSVNVDDPDLVRHPLFRKASPSRVLLHPGDVLYIPAFWHHEVQSVPEKDTSTSAASGSTYKINVAVNFWFANVTDPKIAM